MTVDQLPSRAATRVPSHDHSGRHRQDMWPAEREVCNNYMNGRCFYGIRCRRFHPNLEVDQTSSTEKLRVGGGHPLTFVPPQVDSHRQPAEVAHIGRRNQVHRSSNEQSSHSSAPCNHSQPAQEADALCPIQVDNVERSRKSDEICQKYLKGICAWGSRCHRRHVSSKEGTNSMAPALLKQSEDQKVSRATTPMQATNGTTKLPERLQKESYMRLRQGYPVPEEERAFVRGSTPSTSPVVYTTPIPEWMCRDFVRGHCSRDQCRWKHPPPEICAKYLVYRGSESEQTLRPVGTPSRPIEADITLPSLASSTSTIASSARLRTPPPNSDAPAHDDSELCELLGIRRGTSQHDSPKIPVVKLPVATSAKMELSKGKGKARASSVRTYVFYGASLDIIRISAIR
ncbi:hypothetical protein OBBRIDRAFT_132510 [Obba rivulosa]|uniref:C3H1-type domain-containing protein n=1 Tax=Obba rivulosa TaxID=1052685 RepID=A0A8E2AYI1_9APHY|nr:hypothetical protein OBBRIDRAFT_132510 [Obba rivulosa]